MSSTEQSLNIWQHLAELRRRIMISFVAFFIASGASWFLARYVFEWFMSRAPSSTTFVYTDVTEMFFTYSKISLYMGAVIALPVIVYQLVAFIHPGLSRKEKGYVYTAGPMILALFVAGMAYTYYVFLPPTLDFLINYKFVPEVGTRIVPMIKIGSYISFMTKSLFWIGLIFELPAVIFLLAKIGIVSHKWLIKKWKWIVIVIVLISGVVTPTGSSLTNQTAAQIVFLDFGLIVSGPAFGLYVLSIFLAWLARRPKKASASVTSGTPTGGYL